MSNPQLTARQQALIDAWAGRPWTEAREAGVLPELYTAFGGSVNGICTALRWQRTGGIRAVFSKVANEVPAEVSCITSGIAGLPSSVHKLLTAPATAAIPLSIIEIADKLDRSPASVRAAVAQLRAAGYEVELAEDDRPVLQRVPVPQTAAYVHPGWGEASVLLGVVSDTHLGTTHAMEDELHAVYDRFASEGVATVLHCGDLMDGPAHRGYPGHSLELRTDCQTAIQQVQYAAANYPRREGLRTLFIESGKSHAGWEFAATGFSMGRALAEGAEVPEYHPGGVQYTQVGGRDDMTFLGFDERVLGFGPEGNTRVSVLHPDGGSAYALSYRLQKYAESLEGGEKPHVVFSGHYHKYVQMFPRNIHAFCVPTLEHQTPFMRRRSMPAHLGALLVELSVDSDGTVRRIWCEMLPFFRPVQNVYQVGGCEPVKEEEMEKL